MANGPLKPFGKVESVSAFSLDDLNLQLLLNDLDRGLIAASATRLTNANLIIGTNADNTLFGGAGNDTIFGAGGNDTIFGGLGTDSMLGGDGDDTYHVNTGADLITEGESKGTDSVISLASYTLGAHIENLTLIGAQAINATGNERDNILTGNSNVNILIGGAGDDTLIGGAGNDQYYIDTLSDSVIENANEGTDVVFSAITYTLGDELENLTLLGTDAINGTGNGLNNLIMGNYANNVLSGGTGNDTIYGSYGNDTLRGDTGTDLLFGGDDDDLYYLFDEGDTAIEYADEGASDKVFSRLADYTLGDNIELLSLDGSDNINGNGNALTNRISGNAGDNLIHAMGGNDDIYAGAGHDTIYGDSGNDLLKGDAGNDVIIGGAGHDNMHGGTGADRFVWNELTDPGFGRYERDVINDFNAAEQDLFDFSQFAIPLTFIGAGAFSSTAGELHYTYDGLGNTILSADTSGDGNADFEIQLVGIHTLTANDFLLS